jgi:hypothetical protein
VLRTQHRSWSTHEEAVDVGRGEAGRRGASWTGRCVRASSRRMGSVAEKGRSGGGLVAEEVRSFKMTRFLELEPRPSEIRPIRLPSESYSLKSLKVYIGQSPNRSRGQNLLYFRELFLSIDRS